MNTVYYTNSSSYSTLGFAYFSSGDDLKLEVRCEMEVDAAQRGMDELTEALDALEALKERMGDLFTEKQYQQRRKGLLKAALNDAEAAAKLEKGGGDTPSSAPQKLAWTLINEAVGNGHDWESAYGTLDFEIISGPNYILTSSQLFRTIHNLLRSTVLHYGLPNTYTYMISNGIPGSTYLGTTSAELAPTSEWVTQLPTLACKYL